MKRDALPLAAAPVASGEIAASAWRAALPALAAALVFVGVCYAETAAGMVGTWYRSTTFTHGFVVGPISLWLIWRKRDELGRIEPGPWLSALPLFAAAGAAWLLGEFGAVNAVSQAAFVAMLILTVPAVLGTRVARAMMFPLGFLFFAVPVGDFLLPTLMERTADFTVWALRATGVPVYREGLLLVVPSGRWSIVEACSGVRYLIASLMAGTLFAYLNYRANWRRWVFVGIAAAVPIVANWIRAYLIVLIGHLSNNRLAVGVDHLIYGWIFFGFVMLIMFWLGSRWQEPPPSAAGIAEAATAVPAMPTSPVRFWTAAAAVMAVALVWPLANSATEVPVRESPPSLEIGGVAGWQAVPDDSGFAPHFESPSAFVHESWRRGGETAGFHVAYYREQNAERKLVSSSNVLVRSEDRAWVRTIVGERDVLVRDARYRVAETRLQGPGGRSYVVWQWYWIDGTITTNDALAKARIGWSRLAHRRDDSAAIVLYAQDGNGQRAVETLERFTHDAWPAIEAGLARAAAGG